MCLAPYMLVLGQLLATVGAGVKYVVWSQLLYMNREQPEVTFPCYAIMTACVKIECKVKPKQVTVHYVELVTFEIRMIHL